MLNQEESHSQKRKLCGVEDVSVAYKKSREEDFVSDNDQNFLTSWQDHNPDLYPSFFEDNFVTDLWQDFPSWESDIDYSELHTVSEEPSSQATDLEGPSTAYHDSDDQNVSQEICLGLIVAETTSYSDQFSDKDKLPVQIMPFGDTLKMHHVESDRCVGLISTPGVKSMLELYHVRITANLVKSKIPRQDNTLKSSRSHKTYGFQKNSTPDHHNCTVRMIIYADRNEQREIGEILSKEDTYLQHPLATECDVDIEYSNPHYLLRTGAEPPKLEDVSLNEHEDGGASSTLSILDEVWKSRVMRVFDDTSSLMMHPSKEQSPWLASELKKHQLTALEFMIEKEIGSLDNPVFPQLWRPVPSSSLIQKYRHVITCIERDSPEPLRGGVLADEMGLGKTLSVLALVCASLDGPRQPTDKDDSQNPRQTLVIAPKSVLPNWLLQTDRHIKAGKLKKFLYHGHLKTEVNDELSVSNIVFTTYETLRSEWATKGRLLANKWLRVVLDEAHHIRNRASQVFKAACSLQSQYRWCITGTPIHNSIDDYGALIAFLGAKALERKAEFDYWIASPLKRDSSNSMKALHDLIQSSCLRRTKAAMNDYVKLPKCTEKIEIVKLHESDRKLYEFFRKEAARLARQDHYSSLEEDGLKQEIGQNLVTLLSSLRLICNHGQQLLPASAASLWHMHESSSANEKQIPAIRDTCHQCGCLLEGVDGIVQSHSHPDKCGFCVLHDNTDLLMSNESNESFPQQGSSFVDIQMKEAGPVVSLPSAKIKALIKVINSEQSGNANIDQTFPIKSVIFSFWTKMLDLIESALESQGLQIARIDGSTTLESRERAIHRFDTDPKCTVMLASITSAGEGVNFTTATHVHLIEPHWNPMAEAQSVARIHRIGQTRETTVTRYIVENSIEEYVRMVQQHKLELISRSLAHETRSQQEINQQRWGVSDSRLQGEMSHVFFPITSLDIIASYHPTGKRSYWD